jgi:V8-like Glu-specific endopeptidase
MRSRRQRLRLRVACVALAAAFVPSLVLAGGLVTQANPNPASTKSYWTPERLRDARPLPAAELDFDAVAAETQETLAPAAPVVSGEGRAPLAGPRPAAKRLADPAELEPEGDPAGDPAEKANGSTGAYFTSARLVPVTADQSYPYTTVGKLFFTIPGQGNFFCSAAVVKARLVLTAAQCIHSGTTSPGFFTNFQFVPALRDNVAPFGTWDWAYVALHTTWTNGGGKLPNATDYGLIEMQDQSINGATRRVGDVVGYLGYATQKLRPNHAHLLGYASNFDSGQKMHQVTGQAFRAAANNNAEYGSDLRGGSAGAPLIQDFGDNAALAKVIGVVSYSTTSAPVKTEGASIPDSRFISVLNTACAHRSGNCT